MAIPADPPTAFAPLLQLERSRLLDLLTGLTAEEWHLGTPCPDWTVLDLVGHLVGDDLSLISWQRDHHHGTPPPAGVDESGFIDWLDELQRRWVRAARRISPELMVELLVFLDDPVAETIASLDPRARTANVSWAGDVLHPALLDHGRELSERWIHRQQLREAIGQPSDLRPDLAGPVLDTLRWAWPYRLGDVDRAAGTTVSVEVNGDGLHRHWCLVRTEHDWTFDDHLVDRPDASVTMSTEQAWRLLTNNHRADAHGPIDVDGDPRLGAVVLETRGIIGHPR